jgi:tetratricopeptide (TPR) repeat protein
MSPNSAEAHYRYALLLSNQLRNGEALAEIRRAEELDPLSVAVSQVAGSILYFAGRDAEAVERLKRAIEIDPSTTFAHDNLGLALCHEGKFDEGLGEIKKAIGLDPNNVMLMADLCYAYSIAGKLDEAKGVLARVESDQRNRNAVHFPPMALAGMYACLGQTDRSFEWLQKAHAEHSPYLCSLKVERWFDGIRNDPRFVALLGRVGLGPNLTVIDRAESVADEDKADRLASNLSKSGYRRVEDKLPVVLGENVGFRLITYNEETTEYIVCDYADPPTKATVEKLLDKLKLLSRSNFDYKVRLGVLLSDREPPGDVKEYVSKLAATKFPIQVLTDPDKMSGIVS